MLRQHWTPDLEAAKGCAECDATGLSFEPCHIHADFCPRSCEDTYIPCGNCQEPPERPCIDWAAAWLDEAARKGY